MSSVYINSAPKEAGGEITVSYPVREQTQAISKGDYYAVRCIAEHNKVRAIKFIRLQHKLGLWEAKQIVETIMNSTEVPVGSGDYT